MLTTAALAAGVGIGALALLKLYGSSNSPFELVQDSSFSKNQLSYSEECNQRAKQLSDVSYRLFIVLSQYEEIDYKGCVEVKFVAKNLDLQPIYIDFQGKSIGGVIINGR